MNSACTDRVAGQRATPGTASRKTLGGILIVAAAMTWAGGAAAASLGEIYAEALQKDPVLAIERAGAASSKEGVVQARAAFLPNLSASMSRSGGTQSSDRLLPNGQRSPDVKFKGGGWSAGMNQQVLNVPNWFRYRGAQASARQAEWSLEFAERSLITRVAEAYLWVLRGEAALESAVAAEEAVRRQLEQVQQRFDVGLVAITDVLDAKARYDNAVVSRIEAEGNHDNYFEGLRTLTGTHYVEVDRLAASLPIIDPAPADEAEWVRTAMANNHQIRAAQEALAAAEQRLKSSLAVHLPTISGGMNYSVNDGGTQSFQGLVLDIPGSSSVNYSLRLSVPIFQGLSTHSGVRDARIGLERARQQLIQQELTVGRDARNLYRTVVTDVVRVAARGEAIKSAEAALEATQTGYEVGTRNIVEVLDAQQNLFQSQYDYATSRYDYVVRLLQLKRTAGVLDERDVQELDRYMDAANPVTPFSLRPVPTAQP